MDKLDIEELWNLQITPENEPQSQTEDFIWDFNADTILTQHAEAIAKYHNKQIKLESVKRFMKCFGIIKTPPELFRKHIIPKPISSLKAIELAKTRDRFQGYNTCFEDPELFYHYSNLRLLVAKHPVRGYQVAARKNSNHFHSYKLK